MNSIILVFQLPKLHFLLDILDMRKINEWIEPPDYMQKTFMIYDLHTK